MIEKVVKILDQSLEYLLLSFFLASAGLLLPAEREEKKESIAYFISAVILGTVTGVVSHNTPMLTDFDYMLACISTISGPATYALIKRRTLIDLIRMYNNAKKGVYDGKKESPKGIPEDSEEKLGK
mgnify:CR=1 FL=1|tara:strand:+ start:7539 stop:7916 length:378 start_codon:yes stop_codon:yes gene_type:complete